MLYVQLCVMCRISATKFSVQIDLAFYLCDLASFFKVPIRVSLHATKEQGKVGVCHKEYTGMNEGKQTANEYACIRQLMALYCCKQHVLDVSFVCRPNTLTYDECNESCRLKEEQELEDSAGIHICPLCSGNLLK